MLSIILCLFISLFAGFAEAGSIAKNTKSFGGVDFINGVVPQASDFNGDIDTIYSEFNGNIDNSNIKASAAIAAAKINPDGYTISARTTNVAPCTILDETDQGADLRRWATCSNAGVFQIGTYTDAFALQNNWLTIVRANGGFTIGGTSGTNVVNGATTFNQTVTFVGPTSISPTGMVAMYMGTSAPSGWLLMNGASNSCTGASAINSLLCTQLISLFPTANYKGTALAVVTADTASDEILHTAHGKAVNDRVHFGTTVTLPSPLSSATVYCIISVTADRYKVSTTCGGAAVDLTTTGTGTHSDYFSFLVPDTSGRTGIGTGAVSTVETITGVTASGNTVAVATNNHKWQTGMPVVVTNASGFAGLVNGSFFMIRNSSTSISIATTLVNAQNGILVTVTGTGNATFTYTGTTYAIGEFGGEEEHAMRSAELLAHTHTASTGAAGPNAPAAGGSQARSNVGATDAAVFNTGSTGGNVAMPIITPFLGMAYIIKL